MSENTRGMTNEERWKHVGAWQNEQGHICFATPMGVEAMLQQLAEDMRFAFTRAEQAKPAEFIGAELKCYPDELSDAINNAAYAAIAAKGSTQLTELILQSHLKKLCKMQREYLKRSLKEE